MKLSASSLYLYSFSGSIIVYLQKFFSVQFPCTQRHFTHNIQINIKIRLVASYYFTYICSVFFMVLDLRLTKGVGCRETVNTRFIATPHLL